MSHKVNINADKHAQFISESRRPIRPYLCSTLHDFQEERDFLATNIFPQLNEICNSRGTYFRAVDLKWAGWQGLGPSPAGRLTQCACLHSQRLKLCLDHINGCFPFFIGLLGQTYGDFLPACSTVKFSEVADPLGLSTVQQNLYIAARNGYPWVLDEPNCSLTEYEITQAAFLQESPFQYFYFRTGTTLLKALNEDKEGQLSSVSLVNDEGQLKLGKLKAKILSKGLPVRYYRDLSELGELVFKDWLVVIEKLYPATPMMENIDHKHNFERLFHEEFMEKCRQVFVASKESDRTFEILEKFTLAVVQSDFNKGAASLTFESASRENSSASSKSILLLSGDHGCGKSTLIANWVHHFRESNPDVLLVPYFVGSTCESSDVMSVMHYFVTELQRRHYGTVPETDILNEESSILVFPILVEVFLAAISLRPCIIVLDGIEDLVGVYGISGQKSKDFSWLPPSLPPLCKFILTTAPSSLSCKSLCARSDVRVVRLTSAVDEEAQLNIFSRHFSIPGHEEPFRLNSHAQRKNANLSPLKLAILASELRECRLYRDEAKCLQEYLKGSSVQELWQLVLRRWSQDYSWSFQQDLAGSHLGMASGEGLHDWVADALCLLSVSHCGLMEEEILQLLDSLGYTNQYKVTPLHWAAFRSATKQWVQEKPSGRLYFRHQTLRNAVEHWLLGVVAPVRESCPRVSQGPVSHRKTHLHRTLVRFFQRRAFFWRVYEELPWHMKMSSCWQGLCSFLSSPSIIDFLSKIQSPSFWTGLQLIHYWNALSEAGYKILEAYQLTVSKLRGRQRHKTKKRSSLSVLESSPVGVTPADKCRLIFFVGRFLKFLGKTREAEDLLLIAEEVLEQNGCLAEMLLSVQNTVGELYLQIGMTWESFQCFQKAWWNLCQVPSSKLRENQDLVKKKGRVLNNLVKTASEEYLLDSPLLDHASDVSSLLDNNPWDQATMKYTEGILILATGDTHQAKMKLHECLTIRKSLLGERNLLVGEIMELIADVLFFPLRDSEKFPGKKAVEYYKQVIKIKEDADSQANSLLVKKQLSVSLSDTLCKLAGQLLIIDSCHHSAIIEAAGYLYRSLDLRATYLGSSHPSFYGILHLLREIERILGKRCWPQGKSQQFSEYLRNGASLWEPLLKLDYHSAQSCKTVSCSLYTNAEKLSRAKIIDLTAQAVSDRPKYASRKGKKALKPIFSTFDEVWQKAQKNTELWKGPEKQVATKTENWSSKIFSWGNLENAIQFSRQRMLSDKMNDRKGLSLSTTSQHLLSRSNNTNHPWESLSDLIKEKWLFHSPDNSSASWK